MSKSSTVKTLFLDIGGVLLSNGWGRDSRRSAADHFNLDLNDIEERHHLSYTIFEEGKLTLREYLKRVIFYQERPFTADRFIEFMYSQSTPYPEMIELFNRLKEKYKLKIAVVNNEGRELNEYRIRKFRLNEFVDFFISSCFVHYRKPDTDIFQIALDIAQVSAHKVLYIEDRQLFVDVAGDLGIRGIQHRDYLSTANELAALGLKID